MRHSIRACAGLTVGTRCNGAGQLHQRSLSQLLFDIKPKWISTASPTLPAKPILDRHRKSVIVGGRGTVTGLDMPFVNRAEELWRIFKVNAETCSLLRSLEDEPTSEQLRDCNLLFCIQYFGGGMTTLGKKFGAKLSEGVLDERAKKCMELEPEWRLATEWALVRSGIETVYCNLSSPTDIVVGVLRRVLNDDNATYSDIEMAAVQVVAAALKRGMPLLILMDEVGSNTEHNLKDLRAFVQEIYIKMWRVISNERREMPRIYFLVTGRSVDYFEPAILAGVAKSPLGTELLVLNMLEPEHVSEIRRCLQSRKPPLVLNGVTDDVAEHLDQSLCTVTGGAPRLLLYTLRALHYLCVYEGISLNSEAKIDHAVNDRAFELLTSISTVRQELMPAHTDPRKHEMVSNEIALLLAYALYEPFLKYDFVVRVAGGPRIELGRLLMPSFWPIVKTANPMNLF